MTAELVQEIIFGKDGDDGNHIGSGWSAAEAGYRWSVGPQSEIWLENPGGGDAFILDLQLNPFRFPPELIAQRLAVEVRGTLIGRSVVDANGRRAYRVPAELLSGRGPVRVILHHEDAKAPFEFGREDRRQLAFSLRRLRLYRVTGEMGQLKLNGEGGISVVEMERLAGLPAAKFMLHFESLGDNCEFGLVQRRCGAEPMSLLRFSNLELHHLLRGLHSRFEGIGTADKLEFWLSDTTPREYVIRDKAYSLTFHTWQREGEVDENALIIQQARRLQFLARKLIEDLTDGLKVFVYKRNVPLTEAEVLPLYAALNEYAANTLLWVVPTDAEHSAGTVERILPGLVKGYIDRLAPYENAHDLAFEVWLELCAKTHQIKADGMSQVANLALLGLDARASDAAA